MRLAPRDSITPFAMPPILPLQGGVLLPFPSRNNEDSGKGCKGPKGKARAVTPAWKGGGGGGKGKGDNDLSSVTLFPEAIQNAAEALNRVDCSAAHLFHHATPLASGEQHLFTEAEVARLRKIYDDILRDTAIVRDMLGQ